MGERSDQFAITFGSQNQRTR